MSARTASKMELGAVGGDGESGLRHQGEEAHRFQVTVFPPVLGPG